MGRAGASRPPGRGAIPASEATVSALHRCPPSQRRAPDPSRPRCAARCAALPPGASSVKAASCSTTWARTPARSRAARTPTSPSSAASTGWRTRACTLARARASPRTPSTGRLPKSPGCGSAPAHGAAHARPLGYRKQPGAPPGEPPKLPLLAKQGQFLWRKCPPWRCFCSPRGGWEKDAARRSQQAARKGRGSVRKFPQEGNVRYYDGTMSIASGGGVNMGGGAFGAASRSCIYEIARQPAIRVREEQGCHTHIFTYSPL